MIQTYTLLQIGAFHTNHCEDFFIVEPISKHLQVVAVMDGCSMGTESVFASILYGKLLRKICQQLYYSDFISPQTLSLKDKLRSVTLQLFDELKKSKNALALDTSELLSTLVLAVVDTDKNSAECVVIGDGLICIDGLMIEFEQNDRPDYLAYHLGKTANSWYADQRQFITVNSFNDLTLSTDGIFSFKAHTKGAKDSAFEEIANFFMHDQTDMKLDNSLMRKLRLVDKMYQMAPTDDLSIVRLINCAS